MPTFSQSTPAVRLLELRNTYKWGGGPDKTILLSAVQHDPQRVAVVVVYIRDARDQTFRLADQARAQGLTCYEIVERGKFDPRVLRALHDIIVRHDINVIHAHDYKSDLFAYLVQYGRWRQPMALLSTAHAWVMLGLRGEVYRRLDLWLMRRFHHLIAVSHATKAEMVAAGIPPAKISVIHNAIDPETWAPGHISTDLRAELGLREAFPILGYVGRIMPEKDLETWLRAAAVVAQQCPTARFVWVGEGRDGTTLTHLKTLAATLGIADRLTCVGYRHELLPVYAMFDVFVLTSRREGLPNSLLEAMAMGLPVVTTDVAGTAELVIHGQTGFVVPQGDVARLAHCLLTLAQNQSLRRRLAQAGRERIVCEFAFKKRLRRIEHLYEWLVGLRANTRPQACPVDTDG